MAKKINKIDEKKIDSSNRDLLKKPITKEKQEENVPLSTHRIKEIISQLFENKDLDKEGKKLGQIISKIDNLNNIEEYLYFLKEFEKEGKKRHSLPQEIFTAILEKGFKLGHMLEKGHKKESFSYFLFEYIHSSLQLHDDFQPKNDQDLSSIDKTFIAFQKLYYKYPKEAERLWQILDCKNIKPEVLINGIVEMSWRPGVFFYFRQEAISKLNHLLTFHKGYLNEAIRKSLDFENVEDFSQTAHWLEFLRSLFYHSQKWSFYRETASEVIIPILKKAVAKKEGSYLLNKRAQHILREIEFYQLNPSYFPKGGSSFFIFKISPDRFAFFSPKKDLIVFQPDNFKNIEQDLLKIKELVRRGVSEKLINGAIMEGLIFKEYLKKDPYLLKQVYEDLSKISGDLKLIYQRMLEYSFRPLEISDIILHSSSRQDPTQQKKNMEILFDYEYLVSPFMQDQIEKDFGIDITNLSLPVQNWFLQFIKRKKMSEIEPVIKFVKKYKESGLKTFLSLELGMEIGDKILEIGEKFNKEAAQNIFNKYSEIIDAKEKIQNYLFEYFGSQKNYSQEDFNSIIDNLMRKGRELLIYYASQAERLTKQEQKSLVQEIIKQLESYKTEILLFASIFKSLSSKEKIDFNEIKETKLIKKDTSDLTLKEKEKMVEIFKNNRIGVYPDKLLEISLSSFKEALNLKGKEIFILTYKGEPVSFIRFDKLGENRLFAASFNVRPEARSSSIGRAMLKATLDKKARNYVIEAEAYTKIPIVANYIGEFGFVARGIDLDYKGSGEAFFIMERDDEKNKKFITRQFTSEQIFREYLNNFVDNQFKPSQRFIILHFDLEHQEKEFRKVCDRLLNQQDYVLTRFLRINPQEVYLVFEKEQI